MEDYKSSGGLLDKMNYKRTLKTVQTVLCSAVASVVFSCASWATAEQPTLDQAQVSSFINEMVEKDGYSRAELNKIFASAEHKTRIIELISKPAEGRLTWERYRNLFINDRRIDQGVEYWQQHRSTLERAAQEYGVAPSVIIGILGIETSFGRNSGGFRVVDALSTLGFGFPRRAAFFKKELREFLLLTKEQGFDPLELKGSYAGAMGIPQFMPSSYRAYAVDFDGNGQADIWNTPADAIGSIASYLKRHGWEANAPVAVQATLTKNDAAKLATSNSLPSMTIEELVSKGWKNDSPLPKGIKVRPLVLDGANGDEYWLTAKNFYAITRYNRSDLYAMAVWQLGEHVEKKLKSMDAKKG